MNDNKEFKELPEGWKWVRLGEIIEEVKEKNHLNKNLPILTSSRKGIYLQDEYFNRIVASKDISNYKMIKKGEFTYRSMSDDETFVFNRLEDIPVGLVSPAYFVFQVKEGYSGDYLKYLLNNSVGIKRQIYKEIKGTTRVALKFNQLTNFVAHLPPLPEQQKIAEILETIDNAIEKTDRIIEKYKRIKQGLMHDLLTKGIDENGNIRSEKTHKFKDSPLGRIPEEWEVVRLGEVASITSSKRIYYNEYLTEGVPFFRSKEIIELSAGSFSGATLYISHDKFRYIANKFGAPEVGDILITAVGTLGIVYLVKQEDLPFYFKDGNLLWVKLGENLNKLYFVKSFSSWFNIQKDDLTIGTSQSALTIEKLKEMLIPLPPLPEQQRIAEILSQIDQTIEKEQQYKEKLQKIKQGLMQDLLTGKVRVNKLLEVENNELRKS